MESPDTRISGFEFPFQITGADIRAAVLPMARCRGGDAWNCSVGSLRVACTAKLPRYLCFKQLLHGSLESADNGAMLNGS